MTEPSNDLVRELRKEADAWDGPHTHTEQSVAKWLRTAADAIETERAMMLPVLRRAVAAELSLERMRKALQELDRRGGLGLDVHERIRDALKPATGA